MPCASQSALFIFQVVKLPLCQAAGNTLINTIGRSKLSYFIDFLVCYRLFKKYVQYTNFIKVMLQPIGAGNFKGEETELALDPKRVNLINSVVILHSVNLTEIL